MAAPTPATPTAPSVPQAVGKGLSNRVFPGRVSLRPPGKQEPGLVGVKMAILTAQLGVQAAKTWIPPARSFPGSAELKRTLHLLCFPLKAGPTASGV